MSVNRMQLTNNDRAHRAVYDAKEINGEGNSPKASKTLFINASLNRFRYLVHFGSIKSNAIHTGKYNILGR